MEILMEERLHLIDDKYTATGDPIVPVALHRTSSTSYILVEVLPTPDGKVSYELGGLTQSEFEDISLDHQKNICHMYL